MMPGDRLVELCDWATTGCNTLSSAVVELLLSLDELVTPINVALATNNRTASRVITLDYDTLRSDRLEAPT